jgi:hypothetical protein
MSCCCCVNSDLTVAPLEKGETGGVSVLETDLMISGEDSRFLLLPEAWIGSCS